MKICISSDNVDYEYSVPSASALHSYGSNGEYWFAMCNIDLKYSYIIRYNIIDDTSPIYKYIDNRLEDRSP